MMMPSSQTISPVVIGCAGKTLSADEVALFSDYNPWGLILFNRNLDDSAQIKALIAQFQEAVGRKNAPIFIDQEGGRVQRLRPPLSPDFMAMGEIGTLYQKQPEEAIALLQTTITALSMPLKKLGINANCAPVADLRLEAMHEVIAMRSFSHDPDICKFLADIAMRTFIENGIAPILKHVPGYGRVKSDPHHFLPYIDAPLEQLEQSDFIPFQKLLHAPAMMSAHIIIEAIDAHYPATQSRLIMHHLIREKWGYDGLLITDDIMMEALAGSVCERACASLKAGNDIILHCSGDFTQMQELFQAVAPFPSSVQSQKRMMNFEHIYSLREY